MYVWRRKTLGDYQFELIHSLHVRHPEFCELSRLHIKAFFHNLRTTPHSHMFFVFNVFSRLNIIIIIIIIIIIHMIHTIHIIKHYPPTPPHSWGLLPGFVCPFCWAMLHHETRKTSVDAWRGELGPFAQLERLS